MTTKAEIQTLLRFLSQDAKVPLPTAMSKVKELQEGHLTRYLPLSLFPSGDHWSSLITLPALRPSPKRPFPPFNPSLPMRNSPNKSLPPRNAYRRSGHLAQSPHHRLPNVENPSLQTTMAPHPTPLLSKNRLPCLRPVRVRMS